MAVVPPDLRQMETQINEVVKEKEAAIQAQEFEKAARFRDEEKDLKRQLGELKKNWKVESSDSAAIVDTRLVCRVIADITGIPVSEVEEEETRKLLRMEEELGKWIIGQAGALDAVSKAIRRNRAGLRDPRRPIGSFLFTGPTGVGKTEVARRLAEFMFGDQTSLIRVDMSEYMEKFSVSRLVGAPPGYVGYDEGGMLTEKVRRKPYAVILLDEIEKAHHDVFNILLQVLEDGQLTDSFGRTVDFKNTVLIMTSNVGSRRAKESKPLGFDSEQKGYHDTRLKAVIDQDLKRTFSPEFLNRVDELIYFNSLGQKEMHDIVEIMLLDVNKRLKNMEIVFEFSAPAKDFLCRVGYDPEQGARPLRRAIQKYVEDPLSEKLLRGEIRSGSVLHVDAGNDKLTFAIEAIPEVGAPADLTVDPVAGA
jgi:ATP-dependent Clp protease ATP-binding subunit ClpC